MDNNTFNTIVAKRVEKIHNVLGTKAIEYSHDNDRLYNFKVGARMNYSSPQKVLWGFALKHLICVDDIVNGRLTNNEQLVSEKVGDLINYLILLEAVLYEEREENVRT